MTMTLGAIGGKRGLQRIAAMLAQRGRGHVDDDAVADIAKLALTGLAHQPAA
jgi:hypothetical protein